MLIPFGFSQKSTQTNLGYIVYYTNNCPPWNDTEVNSRETLIFLHGLGGGSSAYEWSKVYPAFATEYCILAPDLVGWGRSAHPERNYEVEDYVTSIQKFIEQTCSEPVIVIASALTAAFTIRAAIARPELFKSLILTTAAGLNEFGKNYQDNFFTKLAATPIIDRLLYSTGVATSFGIRSFLEQRQFAKGDQVYPELVEAYLQSAQQPNAEYAALSFVRERRSLFRSNSVYYSINHSYSIDLGSGIRIYRTRSRTAFTRNESPSNLHYVPVERCRFYTPVRTS